jgi:hypothetical protein
MSNLSIATSTSPPPTPNAVQIPNTNAGSSIVKARSGFFGRWTSGQTLTIPIPVNGVNIVNGEIVEDGPVDELIVAGTAFGKFRCFFFFIVFRSTVSALVGYGLFNLVFSLLPKKIQYAIPIHEAV